MGGLSRSLTAESIDAAQPEGGPLGINTVPLRKGVR